MNNDNPNRSIKPSGEKSAETMRSAFETRGDKTFKAAIEAEEKERLENYLEIQKRREAIQKRLAEIESRRMEIRQEKSQITHGNTGSKESSSGTPINTSAEMSKAETDNNREDIAEGLSVAPVNTSEAKGPTDSPINDGKEESTLGSDKTQNETIQEHEIEDPARREKIERVSKKTKHNSGFKKVAQRIALIAMSGLIALGIGTNLFGAHKNQQAKPTEQPQSTVSTVVNQESQDYQIEKQESDNQETERQEAEKGIYDGYNKKGMWLSNNKAGKYNFAAAKEVAEECNDDECEMMKYAEHNQVETFADHIANVPDAVKDKYGIPASFKGASILQTEKMLEGLSEEEFEDLQNKFDKLIDDAMTSQVLLNGKCDNAFMRLKNPSGPVTHANMELVKCTTIEKNTLATEFSWPDENGNPIGSMIVKFTPEGGCMQVINKIGTPIYKEMPTINPADNTPTPPYIPPKEQPTPEQPTPEDPTPEEPTPEQPTPEEPTPEQPTPEEPTPEDPTPEDPTPEDPTPEEPTPEEPTPEDPTPEDPTPEEPTPEDPTPEDPTPEDPTPEEPTPEDPTPEDPTPEDPTPEDPTPEDPTPEDPTPEDPTPEDPTPEDPTPEQPESKDSENLTRIDENIKNDIEDDVNTEQIEIVKNEEANPDNITEQPTAEDFQGTEATIVQNEASEEAIPVEQDISEENDYSTDRGGANAGNAAPNPVMDDDAAQEAADAAATPVSEAPTSRQDIADTMADLEATLRQRESSSASTETPVASAEAPITSDETTSSTQTPLEPASQATPESTSTPTQSTESAPTSNPTQSTESTPTSTPTQSTESTPTSTPTQSTAESTSAPTQSAPQTAPASTSSESPSVQPTVIPASSTTSAPTEAPVINQGPVE